MAIENNIDILLDAEVGEFQLKQVDGEGTIWEFEFYSEMLN